MAVKQLIFDLQFKTNKSKRDLETLEKELKEVEKTLANTEEGTLEYAEAQKKLADINRRLTGTMNETSKAAGGLDDKFTKAARSVTTFLGIAGGVQVLRNGVQVFGNYEQALADLSAITGVTGGDLEFFKEQARELGATTTVSATEALKAFELIGSARPELLKNQEALASVTQSAITLAEASGLEIPEAARAVTGALNQFNKSSSEARSVINALAAGSKEGAAAIPALADGLEKFGAVANANNVTLEEAIGLQETLAEKNIQGAEAGTQLRNIILRLNKAGLGFVDGQFNIVAALDQAREGLQSINDPAERAAKLQELFGLESATAAQILLDNTDSVTKYSEAVTGTNTALEQAEIRTNTIQGSLEKLNNRFQDYIIGTGESTDASNKLQDAIDFLSNNLELILDLVVRITRNYLAYAAATRLVSTATKAYTSISKSLGLAQTFVTKGFKAATTAVKGFNSTLRKNIIGLATVALVELADAFGLFSSEVNKTEKQLDEYAETIKKVNEVQERQIENTNEEVAKLTALFNQLKKTNPEMVTRQELIDKINKQYGTTLKNLEDETEFVKQLDLAYQNLVKSIREKIIVDANQEQATLLIKEQFRLQKELNLLALGAARSATGGTLEQSAQAFGEEIERLRVFQSTLTKEEIARADELFQKNQFNANVRADLENKLLDISGRINGLGDQYIMIQEGINDRKQEQEDINGRTVKQIREEIKAQKQLLELATSKAEADKIKANIARLEIELQGILGVQSKSLNKNREQELTFLDRLEERLKRNAEERERIVTLETKESNAYLRSLKNEAIELETQIKQVKALIEAKEILNKTDLTAINIAQSKLDQALALSTSGFDIVDEDPFDTFAERLRQINLELVDLRGLTDPESIAQANKLKEEEARIQQRINAFRRDGIDAAKVNRDFEIVTNNLRVAQIDEEIAALEAKGKITDEIRIKIINLRAEQETLNEKTRELNRIAFEEEGLKLIEEERIDLQERILNGELDTQEQIEAAERETQVRILDLRIDALRDRLSLLDEESLAYKELYNQILDLEIQKQDLEKKGAEERKKFSELSAEEQIDLIKMVADAAVDTSNDIIQQKIDEVDRLIDLQQQRVDKATEIADKGNAEILEQERDRLDKLNQEREKYVQAQKALAAAEFLANTVAALAKTAAESGVLSPIFIATTLAAIIGGVAQARALAAGGSFREGGYTGDGSPYQESTALGNRGYTYHRGEFVMDAATTATGNNRAIFEDVLKGRKDLGAELNKRYAIISSSGGMTNEKADEVIGAIKGMPQTQVIINERGVAKITTKHLNKQKRINNITRRK